MAKHRRPRSPDSRPGAAPCGSAPRRSERTGLCLALTALCALYALTSCETAHQFAPPPPLRAASAASYAVDVEFDVPLDPVSAADPTRYLVMPAGGGAAAVVTTATMIDTVNGRVVQLLIPDWFVSNPDTTDFDVTTTGVLSAYGKSTGTRTTRLHTGLSYHEPMRAWFDDRCSGCHGTARADGSYRTDSYAELLAGGTNSTPNVIPSDVQCLSITKCKPRNSMYDLARLTYLDFEMLRNWIGSYAARP